MFRCFGASSDSHWWASVWTRLSFFLKTCFSCILSKQQAWQSPRPSPNGWFDMVRWPGWHLNGVQSLVPPEFESVEGGVGQKDQWVRSLAIHVSNMFHSNAGKYVHWEIATVRDCGTVLSCWMWLPDDCWFSSRIHWRRRARGTPWRDGTTHTSEETNHTEDTDYTDECHRISTGWCGWCGLEPFIITPSWTVCFTSSFFAWVSRRRRGPSISMFGQLSEGSCDMERLPPWDLCFHMQVSLRKVEWNILRDHTWKEPMEILFWSRSKVICLRVSLYFL